MRATTNKYFSMIYFPLQQQQQQFVSIPPPQYQQLPQNQQQLIQASPQQPIFGQQHSANKYIIANAGRGHPPPQILQQGLVSAPAQQPTVFQQGQQMMGPGHPGFSSPQHAFVNPGPPAFYQNAPQHNPKFPGFVPRAT